MSTIPSLSQQALPSSMDVDFLRQEARLHLEAWASEHWTDYNTHDPGITILELLAYAISDLGLRSSLEIQDYLQGSEANAFFTARQILPNVAYTPADYRRLLIDLDHIRNAWLETVPGGIQGLYSLLLDLEPYQEGAASKPLDLNENWLRGEIRVPGTPSGTFHLYSFYVLFPHWEVLPEIWENKEVKLTRITLPRVRMRLPSNPEFPDHRAYFIEPTFTFSDGTSLTNVGMWVRLQPGLPKVNPPISEPEFRAMLIAQLRNTTFYRPHQTRTRIRADRLQEIRTFIRSYRNLCEDWEAINTIRIQQIGLQISELDLHPEADPIEVIARIYLAVEQFIDPRIRPFTFQELLNKGKPVAEIFEGPLLENGFLPEETLNPIERENKIYTSDLVHLIMLIPGVMGIKGLTLDHYLDRIKAASGVANCLNLRNPALYKPKFSIYDSAVKVYKRSKLVWEVDPSHIRPAGLAPERFTSPFNQVKNRWESLKAESRLMDLSINGLADLPVPEGNQMHVEDYYSVQNDFPRVYGLRQGEITSRESPLRKAQAKQLKAYLLFFEQLLANYCSQLANLHQLFSIRSTAERTSFHQPLYNVPAVQDLYIEFVQEISEDTSLSREDIQEKWEQFIQNCNQYIKRLNDATEARSAFIEQRNGFIDHLLARLAENFTEYAAWSFAKNGGVPGPDAVFDKLDFLQNVPALSSQRALAFDYTARRLTDEGEEIPDTWETENVSGYEKRVAAKLGIPDYRRRSLAEIFDILDYVERFDERDAIAEVPPRTEARFRFWNAKTEDVYRGVPEEERNVDLVDSSRYEILLSSTKYYPVTDGSGDLNPAELRNELAHVLTFAKQAAHYSVHQAEPTSPGCRYYFNLLGEDFNEDDPIARRIEYFENRAETEIEIRKVICLMEGRLTEGMHLVEHILLRPIAGSTEHLHPVTFEVGDHALNFIEDPYSFQATILLPGWTPRFQDPEFRVVVERTLREEMPAHIYLWIYWVELEQMPDLTLVIPKVFLGFETAYRSWLERRWLENITVEERSDVRDNLIRIFNDLRRSGHVTLTNTYHPFTLTT